MYPAEPPELVGNWFSVFWSIFRRVNGCYLPSPMTQLLDVKSLKRGSHEVILVNFAIFAIFGPEDSSQIITMCHYFSLIYIFFLCFSLFINALAIRKMPRGILINLLPPLLWGRCLKTQTIWSLWFNSFKK